MMRRMFKSLLTPRFIIPATVVGAAIALTAADAAKKGVGYTTTPLIPGTTWHVHDGDRPAPRVVTPAETFSHLAKPPSDATVIFDGTNLENFEGGKNGKPGWKVENGYMEVVGGTGSIQTKGKFADFQLHLEFATPAEVKGNSQGRGNSGVLFNGI